MPASTAVTEVPAGTLELTLEGHEPQQLLVPEDKREVEVKLSPTATRRDKDTPSRKRDSYRRLDDLKDSPY